MSGDPKPLSWQQIEQMCDWYKGLYAGGAEDPAMALVRALHGKRVGPK